MVDESTVPHPIDPKWQKLAASAAANAYKGPYALLREICVASPTAPMTQFQDLLAQAETNAKARGGELAQFSAAQAFLDVYALGERNPKPEIKGDDAPVGLKVLDLAFRGTRDAAGTYMYDHHLLDYMNVAVQEQAYRQTMMSMSIAGKGALQRRVSRDELEVETKGLRQNLEAAYRKLGVNDEVISEAMEHIYEQVYFATGPMFRQKKWVEDQHGGANQDGARRG